MISRLLGSRIEQKIGKGKAIVVMGPRQVGKTTLIRHILSSKPHLFLDGDDPTVRNLLHQANTHTLKQLIGQHNIIFIDEAQRINDIGTTLKIITDQFKNVQLTHRKWFFCFFFRAANLRTLNWKKVDVPTLPDFVARA